MVHKVVDELNDSVLSQMPLTDLSDFEVNFKAHEEFAEHLPEDSYYPISVSLVVDYSDVNSSA